MCCETCIHLFFSNTSPPDRPPSNRPTSRGYRPSQSLQIHLIRAQVKIIVICRHIFVGNRGRAMTFFTPEFFYTPYFFYHLHFLPGGGRKYRPVKKIRYFFFQIFGNHGRASADHDFLMCALTKQIPLLKFL